MVAVPDIPKLDTRTQSDIYEEMREALAGKNIILQSQPKNMDPLSALTWLYAGMLHGTKERIGRLPEKHRRCFLNLVHAPADLAWPASGIVVFDVASGYDAPVEIPADTRVTAKLGDESIPFRIVGPLTAVPCAITDVYWLDEASGRYGFSDSTRGLSPWSSEHTEGAAYTAEFVFDNIFMWSNAARLKIDARLDGEKLAASEFCDARAFRFCVVMSDESATEFPASLSAGKGGVLLLLSDMIREAGDITLRAQVLDPHYAQLELGEIALEMPMANVPADAVISGGRQLDNARFSPFDSPFVSFGECAVFCDRVFSQPGAHIEVRFDVEIEEDEQLLPPQPELVDFKWIMKRPQPKPEEHIYDAVANSVAWEYWNGTAFCALPIKPDGYVDLSAARQGACISFVCPTDWQAADYNGRMGYYIRVSCGECGELYRLPRRVHTPVIIDMRLKCEYREAFYPKAAYTQCFGERMELAGLTRAGGYVRLFDALGVGRALLLGFDALFGDCSMRLYFSILCDSLPDGQQSIIARMYTPGGTKRISALDETNGLRESGEIVLDIPSGASPITLFGKDRYWIALQTQNTDFPRIKNIYINTRMAENRVRVEENFSYSNILPGNRLYLSHGNIVKLWLNVRGVLSDDMELWTEYEPLMGDFEGSCYQIDYRTGVLTLPEDFEARSMDTDIRDLLCVVYDYTNGEDANLPAGAVDRMESQIPFIQSVYNPIAITNGANSESEEEEALRKENTLHNGGRLVTKLDYELAAVDMCPLVHSARCIGGNPIKIAVLLKKPGQSGAFQEVARMLPRFLGREGFAGARDGGIRIVPTEDVEYHCTAHIMNRKLWESRVQSLIGELSGFLDPVTGGSSGDGWAIGTLPTFEQIKAFVYHSESGLPFTEVNISFVTGGREYHYAEDMPYNPAYIPGKLTVTVFWESEMNTVGRGEVYAG